MQRYQPTPQQIIFRENLRQVKSLPSSSCGSFMLLSAGENQSITSAPLAKSASTFIDMNKMELPIGSVRSVERLVRDICEKYGVTMSGFFTPAYTSITAAFAGQYQEDNQDCTGLTYATILPTYQAMANRDKHILMITIPYDGALPQVNHLRVPANKSISGQALRAIETTTPSQLANSQTLANNKHLVICIEYDFFQDQTKTAVVDGHTTTVFEAIPHNAHSMKLDVTTLTNDMRTVTVEEKGYRMLHNIEFFCVQPFVINTQGTALSPTERDTVCQSMTEYAVRNNVSAEQQAFSLNAFYHLNETFLAPYGLSTRHSAIFEHALLHMANWPEEEVRDIAFGHYSNREHYWHGSDMPPNTEERVQRCRYFDFEAAFTTEETDQFLKYINARLGRHFFHHAPRRASHNSIKTLAKLIGVDFFDIQDRDARFDFTINLAEAAKVLPEIHAEMKKVLDNPRNLRAHQLYTKEIKPTSQLDGMNSIINELLGERATNRLYLMGELLLTIINHSPLPTHFALHLGKGYVAQMLEAHFYFTVNIGDPQAIIDKLNQAFAPAPAARIVATNASFTGTEEKFHVIVLDRDLLISPAFLLRFRQALSHLLEQKPRHMDQFRPASTFCPKGVAPAHFASFYSEALANLTLTTYKSPHPNTKLALNAALKHFGVMATKDNATASQRIAARRAVKKAERHLKNELTDNELILFKSREQKTIKAAITDLGVALRRK